MAKQETLEFYSSDETAGEATTPDPDPITGELTGSYSEVEDIVENSSAATKAMRKVTQRPENESSSSGDEEEEEEQVGTSREPSSEIDNTRVVGVGKFEITKRKREKEDEDGSGSTDDESREGDAQAALLDEVEQPSARLSLKKKRKSTAKERAVPALTPPPTPRKSQAKKDVKGSEGKNGVANVEDTDTNDQGRPQPKPKRGRKKKEAGTIVVRQGSSSSLATPRGRARKTTQKDSRPPGPGVTPQGQRKSAEGGITAGEIEMIFEMLTAGADWPAIVAKTNALIGLKRLGGNVSKHWKTIAKKRLLDAYGA